ncbi:hypothetical protein HELRODRAFT_189204 [Helobdella robusta]|uniref:Uncharacterized protein n=1 Tax=Helobdella robusta TaxID=6412 RepID=T1FQS5_HELRO|nr:hypothetical protein HELRODRAFT_189204 [Helobdella robusta]ESN96344.1 hypothetical protein HELRODRAFT_189204 [Helobdella robusta]
MPISIPCFFIILIAPFYILIYLRKLKYGRKIKNMSIVSKLELAVSFLTLLMEKKKRLVTSFCLPSFYTLLSFSMVFYTFVLFWGRNYSTISKNYALYVTAFSWFSFQVYLMLLLTCFVNSDGVKTVAQDASPEWKSSWLCVLTYTWVYKLLIKGYKSSLSMKDLWTVDDDLEASRCRTYFNKIKTSKNTSLLKVLFKMFSCNLMLSYLFMLVAIFCMFTVPMILSIFIKFFDNPSAPLWNGVVITTLFFVIYAIESISYQRMTYLGLRVNYGVTSTLIAVIYNKLISLDLNSKQSFLSSSRKLAHHKSRNSTNNNSVTATTNGEILNLLSTDVYIVGEFFSHSYLIWATPLQIILLIVLLWHLLGRAIIILISIIIIVVITVAAISYPLKAYQIRQMKWKDKRLKFLDEILNKIKLLKFYTWESVFEKKLADLRGFELNGLKKFFYLNSINVFISLFVPNLVTFATFSVYSLYVGFLDARVAFTSFSLFGLFQFQLYLTPVIITLSIKSRVSLRRIENFLRLTEQMNYVENITDTESATVGDKRTSLVITDGSFKWSQVGPLVLSNINLRVQEPSLVAIVGQVGSGKSAILSAILGELHKVQGQVEVKGRIAYVPQEAWILNASLRDNILLGQPYEKKKFNEIIGACALTEDLLLLSEGEMTEIGEKGVNLSGGQKQRVSLARSIYQDCDVYLFDDPLSAVDSHVATHIFDSLIGPHGMLKNKTRLLVTHAVNILPHVDQVVVLDGGCIVEQGTYQQLMNNDKYITRVLTSNDHAAKLLNDKFDDGLRNGNINDNSREPDRTEFDTIVVDDVAEGKANLFGNPEVIGKVTWSAYRFYLTLLKYKWAFLAVACFLIFRTFQTLSYIWITRWTGDRHLFKLYNGNIENSSYGAGFNRNITLNIYNQTSHSTGDIINASDINSNDAGAAARSYNGLNAFTFTYDNYEDGVMHYVSRYGFLLLAHAFFVILYCVVRIETSVKACKRLHSTMVHRIMRATMNFFYSTPTGRIINRFSKDLDAIDNTLPDLTHQWLTVLTSLTATILVVSFSVPAFIAVVLLLLALFLSLQHFYLPTVCQLKWLSSNSRSPIYAHVCETVDGLTSMRAFNKQSMFMNRFDQLVNENTVYSCAINAADRWLSIQLEFIGCLVTLFAAVFSIVNRSSLNGSIVGYYMAATIQDSFFLCYLIKIHSSMETTMVSLLRLQEYLNVDVEAVDDCFSEDVQNGGDEVEVKQNLLAHYKSSRLKQEECKGNFLFKNGQIEFRNYSMRYREDLDYALKHVNLLIKSREKVGIMGRTGAGKSSLISALFRFSQSEGSIYIDNYDISKLPLKVLRSNITVLSQDPFIFSDTIRMNLDPTSEHKGSDAVIWKSLEQVSLLHVIKSLPGQLDFFCEANGNNFSVGQRQLLCLARTLLHKTSILILDEATAAVDFETDKLIQSTISREFKDCTVIIIAHRMSSTASCDSFSTTSLNELLLVPSYKVRKIAVGGHAVLAFEYDFQFYIEGYSLFLRLFDIFFKFRQW